MIPKQLQNDNFRFCLIGNYKLWGRYENNKIVERKIFDTSNYDKLMKEKIWKPLGKAPFEAKWQKIGYKYNDPKLIDWLKRGNNYGVIAGYGNLRIIDIDDLKLVSKSDKGFNSFTVKTGSGGRHIYYLSDYDKNHIFKNEAGEMRSKNYMVVGPGCTHPSGNKYEVIRDICIEEVDKKDLYETITPLLKEDSSTTTKTNNKQDKSRSAKEFGIICKLIREGKSKEDLFSEMMLYSKWAESPVQYRELTYKKACDACKKEKPKKKNKKQSEDDINRTSFLFDKNNNCLIEQVYDVDVNKSTFCIYELKTKNISYADKYVYMGNKYKPNKGEEIAKQKILLPSKPLEYGTEEELDKEILDFIYKWLDIPDLDRMFCLWNIKRSWVYDKFFSLSYSRALADTGTGKSRFLNTLGVLHYKTIETCGATTPAPIFRLISKWKGTLSIDEADYVKSDESQDIIKLINVGYEKSACIFRCDENNREDIKTFDVYCPKIIATRREFTDKATESRCITTVMNCTTRTDIKFSLDKSFFTKALEIRNKLLLWRFRNYNIINEGKPKFNVELSHYEPRTQQIINSFIHLFTKESDCKDFTKYMDKFQSEIINTRRNSFEGDIVAALHKLYVNDNKRDISSINIIKEGKMKYRGEDTKPRQLTPYLKSLGLKTEDKVRRTDDGVKRCLILNESFLAILFKRYGLDINEKQETEQNHDIPGEEFP